MDGWMDGWKKQYWPLKKHCQCLIWHNCTGIWLANLSILESFSKQSPLHNFINLGFVAAYVIEKKLLSVVSHSLQVEFWLRSSPSCETSVLGSSVSGELSASSIVL